MEAYKGSIVPEADGFSALRAALSALRAVLPEADGFSALRAALLALRAVLPEADGFSALIGVVLKAGFSVLRAAVPEADVFSALRDAVLEAGFSVLRAAVPEADGFSALRAVVLEADGFSALRAVVLEADGFSVLRAVVPPWKAGSLIGTGGKVIKEIRDEYDCDIQVLDGRFDYFPMVILRGKDIPRLIEAFKRVIRIITSPRVPDIAGDAIDLRILAPRDHVKDFTPIAEKLYTSIQIIEDFGVASLPDDRIIKVIGHRKDVRITASKLAEHLCKCQFDDSVISLFCSELKRLFKPISPFIASFKIRVPDEYTIPVEAAVGLINTDTEIVSAVTRDASNFLIIEVIGKHKQVDQAIKFLKKVIGEASLNVF